MQQQKLEDIEDEDDMGYEEETDDINDEDYQISSHSSVSSSLGPHSLVNGTGNKKPIKSNKFPSSKNVKVVETSSVLSLDELSGLEAEDEEGESFWSMHLQ